MKNVEIEAALGSRNLERLADLSDWAVNSLRDWAREHYTPEQAGRLAQLVSEEAARIDAGNLDLIGFMKVSRSGSFFRLSRVARRYVYAAIMSRRAVAQLGR